MVEFKSCDNCSGKMYVITELGRYFLYCPDCKYREEVENMACLLV